MVDPYCQIIGIPEPPVSEVPAACVTREEGPRSFRPSPEGPDWHASGVFTGRGVAPESQAVSSACNLGGTSNRAR
jgi:hypothetical protein